MKTSIRKITSAIIFSSAVLAAQSCWANTTYSYTGNNFNYIQNDVWLYVPGTYTTDMSVSGSFEMASSIAANATNLFLTPLTYSFTDGRNTYTNLDSVLAYSDSFEVSTDASGSIMNWFIVVRRFQTGTLETVNGYQGVTYDQGSVEPNWFNPTTQRDNGAVWNNPGLWNVISPVPEPETYAMLLVGLGLLGLMAYRRKYFTV